MLLTVSQPGGGLSAKVLAETSFEIADWFAQSETVTFKHAKRGLRLWLCDDMPLWGLMYAETSPRKGRSGINIPDQR